MTPPLFDLRDRIVLLTGAAGGLGVAIAQAMAAHGATLLLSDHNADDCEALARSLRTHGHQAHALPCDLSQPRQVQQLAASALQQHGRIDVLICNAGIQGPAGPLHAIDAQQWDAVMDINLRSAATLCGLLLPAMAECGGGSAILMSSIAGLRGNKAIGVYGLSKAALAQLARNLAVEWGPHNVRVNAIAPGLIRTPLAAGLLADDAFMARRLAQTPLRRPGEPHEIAGVAVMLASVAGAFITGQTLVVDGGTTISDGN
ncbi:SDR family NAD(P)-dependent oxidoreductase [Duganella sp. BuS-21]|uniref:SDR family NAD(P)-dependent oxidoreductase n=1 Tax=Duganella sp. BuS-21 TaxID=2943848 RepID=UPI0035A65044